MATSSSDLMLLEITDIKGNSKTKGYTDQIIVQSFSHGASIPLQYNTSNTERTAGKPSFTEVTFSKMSDLSTPKLYDACARGKKLGDAKIHVGRIENGEFMSVFEYVLTNAMVSNISTSGSNGIPRDTFSLNYTKITQDFTQQNADSTKKGTAAFVWNLESNTAA